MGSLPQQVIGGELGGTGGFDCVSMSMVRQPPVLRIPSSDVVAPASTTTTSVSEYKLKVLSFTKLETSQDSEKH